MLGLMLTFVGYALAAAAGAVATLAAQWYLFNKWISSQPSVPPQTKPSFGPYQLPEVLVKALRSGEIGNPENCIALNLVLQFLFRDLRHSPHVRRWLHRKLTAEFAELLTRTTTGKLFDSVVVREVHLGSELPVLNSITVKEARIDPQLGHLEQIDLSLDLNYSGGFQLAVDANMLLGKAASLAVTVTHLSGQARLQFQRNPYTHWSFSFYSEPHLELAVESHFQGRPLPQVTSLIINQIRKTLKKKHTLPNYKLRYKPFFRKPGLGEDEDDERFGRDISSGTLQVSVMEITRLNLPNPPPAYIYCSLAVDTTAWVEVVQRSDSGSWLTVDVSVARGGAEGGGGGGGAGGSGPPLGIVFKQRFVAARYQPCVLVESVTARSPAAAAGVQRGDLLLAVDGRRVSSLAQAARLLRSGSADRCTLRLERRAVVRGAHPQPPPSPAPGPSATSPVAPTPTPTPAQEDHTPTAPLGEPDPSPMASPVHEHRDSDNRLVAPESPILRRRKLSTDPSNGISLHAGSDTDSGSSSPPSAPGTPAKRPSGVTGTLPTCAEYRSGEEVDSQDEGLQVHRTQELACTKILSFDDTVEFEVKPHHRYLNVSVWGRPRDQNMRGSSSNIATPPAPAQDQLLGHVSVALGPIIAECLATGPLSHQLRPCVLLPPDPHAALNYSHPLTSHSGFEPCLCYGDILLAFLFSSHEPGAVPIHPPNSTQRISRPSSPREPTVTSSFIPSAGLRRHDFVRTHFNRATQCEFCGKKIWLKDAVQCRDCSMTCHKKCVARCQEAASCSGYESSGSPRRSSAQPEIVTTAAEEEPLPLSSQQGGAMGGGGDGQRRSGLGGLLATAAAHARGLKRAGSANNLALPGGSVGSGTLSSAPSSGLPPSRSLPPSPQRSPQPSRKSSLTSGPPPFSLSEEDDVDAALERLLAHPNDDDLMAAAKTSGKNLYSYLPLPERKLRINNMITKLKAAMDAETQARLALEGVTDSSGGRSDPAIAAKNAFLIGKSDEKVQALAVLMLHFCAGLQHAQDLEDSERRDAEKNACDSATTQEAVE